MPTTTFYNYPRPPPETAVGRVRRQADLDGAASGYGPGYCPEGIPIEQENYATQRERDQWGNIARMLDHSGQMIASNPQHGICLFLQHTKPDFKSYSTR